MENPTVINLSVKSMITCSCHCMKASGMINRILELKLEASERAEERPFKYRVVKGNSGITK